MLSFKPTFSLFHLQHTIISMYSSHICRLFGSLKLHILNADLFHSQVCKVLSVGERAERFRLGRMEKGGLADHVAYRRLGFIPSTVGRLGVVTWV